MENKNQKSFFNANIKNRLINTIHSEFEKYSLNRKEIENMKKAELMENTCRILNSLDNLQQIVDEYISDRLRENFRWIEGKNYQEKYMEEHQNFTKLFTEYNVLVSENEKLKNQSTISPTQKKSTGRPKLYGKKEINNIVKLRTSGKSIREIALLMNMSTTTVQKLLKQNKGSTDYSHS